MLQIHSILAPVDFSEHAREVLTVARALAARFEAHLDVLYVLEEPAFPSFYQAGAAALYGKAPDLREQAHAALEQLIEEVSEADVAHGIGYHVRQGQAPDEITAFAEEHDTDLIVIASHGLSGLTHYLLGSVADKVLRRAPCPVFLLKVGGKSVLSDPDAPAGTPETA